MESICSLEKGRPIDVVIPLGIGNPLDLGILLTLEGTLELSLTGKLGTEMLGL